MAPTRKDPNIVITGTPGTGKTTHAEQIAANTGLKHIAVNTIVKDHGCHEGWDEEHKSYIVDEDKLLDLLEPRLEAGGSVVDWHACDLFPERLIDLVVVLRTATAPLHDRLTARGYAAAKLDANVDAEIMGVLAEEAREAYAADVVVELRSDAADDVEANVERVERWVERWREDHPEGVGGSDDGEEDGEQDD